MSPLMSDARSSASFVRGLTLGVTRTVGEGVGVGTGGGAGAASA